MDPPSEEWLPGTDCCESLRDRPYAVVRSTWQTATTITVNPAYRFRFVWVIGLSLFKTTDFIFEVKIIEVLISTSETEVQIIQNTGPQSYKVVWLTDTGMGEETDGGVRLDDIDRQILYAHTGRPNTSATAIAEQVSVSSATVRNRIARLEESGVIEGYHPTINQ